MSEIINKTQSKASLSFSNNDQAKTKEKAFSETIAKIKEDYEGLIKKKDNEIKNYFSIIASENAKLKEEINTKDLEILALNEKIEFYQQSVSEKFYEPDNAFFDTSMGSKNEAEKKIKQLETEHLEAQQKLKDQVQSIQENLNNFFDNCITYRSEEKNSLYYNEINKSLSALESKISDLLEIKMNKEKYEVNLLLTKESLKDENEYLKKKLMNEKTNLLNMINEIKKENEFNIEKEKRLFEEEIQQKFESKLCSCNYSSSKNEDFSRQQGKISLLNKERDQIMNNNYEMFMQISELNDKIQTLNEELEKSNNDNKLNLELIKEKQNEIDEINREYKSLQIEKEFFEKKQLELASTIKELTTKISTLENSNKINETNYKNDISQITSKFTFSIKELNSLLNQKDSSINDMTTEMLELKDSNEHLNEIINEKEEELRKTKEELAKVKNEVFTLNFESKSKKEEYEIVLKANDELEKNKGELVAHLENFKKENFSLLKKLKEKESLLSEVQKQYDKSSKEVDDATRRYSALSLKYESSQNELNNLRSSTIVDKEKYISYDAKMVSLENSNNEYTKRNEILSNRLSEMSSIIDSAYSKLTKYSTISKDILDKKEKIIKLKEIENEIGGLVNAKNILKVTEDNYSKSEKENAKLKARINSLINLTSSRDIQPRFQFNTFSKTGQTQILEKLIKYIKDLNITNELKLVKIQIDYEEEIKKNFSAQGSQEKSKENFIEKVNLRLTDISMSIKEIKTKLDENKEYFDQQLKKHINIDNLKEKISDIQKKYEGTIAGVFEKFLSYNSSSEKGSLYLLLKIPIDVYNGTIERTMKAIEEIVGFINGWYKELEGKYENEVSKGFEELISMTDIKSEFSSINL